MPKALTKAATIVMTLRFSSILILYLLILHYLTIILKNEKQKGSKRTLNNDLSRLLIFKEIIKNGTPQE